MSISRGSGAAATSPAAPSISARRAETFLPPRYFEPVQNGPVGGGRVVRHARQGVVEEPRRPAATVRQHPPQDSRRRDRSGVVVPAVHDGIAERHPHARIRCHAVEVSGFEFRQEPVREQRGHRFGQPFPEPEVARPQPRPRRDPLDRVGQGRHRSGLKEEQPVAVVDGPFDILRSAEEPLHVSRQLGNAPGLLRGHGAVAGPGAGHRAGVHRPLLADRIAGHQRLTEPADGGHDRLVALPGQRVGGECDAGGDGRDHLLHQDRHAGGVSARGISARGASAGGVSARGPSRGVVVDHALLRGGGEATPHRLAQARRLDVERGLVHSRVGRLRQVFGCRRGPHRERPGPDGVRRRLQRSIQPATRVRHRGGRHHEARRHREAVRGGPGEVGGLAAQGLERHAGIFIEPRKRMRWGHRSGSPQGAVTMSSVTIGSDATLVFKDAHQRNPSKKEPACYR